MNEQLTEPIREPQDPAKIINEALRDNRLKEVRIDNSQSKNGTMFITFIIKKP